MGLRSRSIALREGVAWLAKKIFRKRSGSSVRWSANSTRCRAADPKLRHVTLSSSSWRSMAPASSGSWRLFLSRGPSGDALIGKLGQDPIVRNLLLLYSLHPDDMETRVLKALDTAGTRLRKFDAQVELVGIQDGAIQVRLLTSGHACGSTTKNLQAIVEECHLRSGARSNLSCHPRTRRRTIFRLCSVGDPVEVPGCCLCTGRSWTSCRSGRCRLKSLTCLPEHPRPDSASRRSASLDQAFATLRQFARPRQPVERCELCSLAVAHQHPHLVEIASRKIVCACEACATLFDGMAGGKYRRVSRRAQLLADFKMTDAQWENLLIPINMAFFFHSSIEGRIVPLYPSPAGAVESLLPLDAWTEIVEQNAILRAVAARHRSLARQSRRPRPRIISRRILHRANRRMLSTCRPHSRQLERTLRRHRSLDGDRTVLYRSKIASRHREWGSECLS